MGLRNRHADLTTRAFIGHLRRHPLPGLMDDECVAALANIEAQFGDRRSHGAGMEVRLGDERRFVDYILKFDVKDIPLMNSEGIEIDYEQFVGGGPIGACRFARVKRDKSGDYRVFLDGTMPRYAGPERARALRPALVKLTKAMAPEASIRLVGVMDVRGADAGLRLVLDYPDFDAIAANLPALGWTGDTAALRAAFAPWAEAGFTFGLALDVSPEGIGEKIGLETYWQGNSPVYVETIIDRLLNAGLCLPSKAAELRRWIRLLPEPDPFLHTRFTYFKLNYRDGRIYEAKAYLETSSMVHHFDFPAYDRPLRLDLVLSDESGNRLSPSDATALIGDCVAERVTGLRLYGGEDWPDLLRLLAVCREKNRRTEVVLQKRVDRDWLRRVLEAGAGAFLVEAGDDTAEITLATLGGLGAGRGTENGPCLTARWRMHAGNAEELPALTARLNDLGVNELLITGMIPGTGAALQPPTRAQMKEAASFIWNWRFNEEEAGGIVIEIESCFAVMLSMICCGDPEKAPIPGFFDRGCEGGRSFLAIHPGGTISPCRYLPGEQAASFAEYWKHAGTIKAHRQNTGHRPACATCPCARRCTPCPAAPEQVERCTVNA
ncbi:MAG: radical SAM protein [Schwartzia sp.]|nr:radical SAM protein [Schwartzia sp. (in: firmicutes)]